VATSDARGLKDGLSTVTFGTAALVIATLVLVALNFLSRVLVVRSVSPNEWDAFSLGFTLAQVLAALGAFGIPVALARSLPYAASDAERRTIVRTAVLAATVAALAAGGALAVAGPFVGRAVGSSLLGVGLEFFAVAVASLIAATVLAAVFQGFADVLPNALFVQVLNPGLFLAFLLVALLVPPHRVSYPAALTGYAAANAVTLLALIVYTVRKLPARLPPGPREPSATARFARLLLPLAVLGAMTSLAGSGDTLVLGAYRYLEVGFYSVGLTLARLVQVGMAAASYVFLPVASRFLSRRDARAVRLTYATVTKWLTVFALPLFVVFFFLPGASLEFVYGPSYATFVRPLEIVVLGAFLGTLLGPGSVTQVAFGDTRLVALNAVAAGATDLALSFALVPAYGAVGAATAWAAANVLFCGLCVAELVRQQGMHPFGRDFLVPLGVTVLPVGAVLAFVPWSPPLLALPVVALLVAALFVAAVVLTRSIGEGDRLLLEAIEGWTGIRVPFVRSLARLAGRSVPRASGSLRSSDGPDGRPPRDR
jgi:O-antigen/teichoic acid export membrane protein